ncbi:hypothetical protein ACQKKK_20455 [Peribacillus sp. NPDC006672]|uniref:hypothetical protein n=1 Tax=Peribacillus sp. NPDC006672 TaxID=3390606 RepID=UPI003CFEB4BB
MYKKGDSLICQLVRIAVISGAGMKYKIIFGLVIFNVLVFMYKIESIVPFIIAAGLVGLYKGTKTGSDFKKIFNIHKVDFSLKESTTRIELLGALIMSLSTDILSFEYYFYDGLLSANFIYVVFHVLYSLLFGLLLFRFLFLNIFEESHNSRKSMNQ